MLKTHKSFNLCGLLSSPLSPPNTVRRHLPEFDVVQPALQPLWSGHSSVLIMALEIFSTLKVFSLIKIKSFENPPAPSCPLSLGSTSPPNTTMYESSPLTYEKKEFVLKISIIRPDIMYFWIQTKQSCEFSLLVCSQRYKHFLERVVLYLLRASIVLTSNQKRICHPFLGQQSPQAEKACLHNSMPPDWLHPFQQSSPSSQFLYFHTSKRIHYIKITKPISLYVLYTMFLIVY